MNENSPIKWGNRYESKYYIQKIYVIILKHPTTYGSQKKSTLYFDFFIQSISKTSFAKGPGTGHCQGCKQKKKVQPNTSCAVLPSIINIFISDSKGKSLKFIFKFIRWLHKWTNTRQDLWKPEDVRKIFLYV